MNDLVRVSQLCKSYGLSNAKAVALDNLNLVIKEQSFTAIVGRSGSGKTTLLNVLGGLEAPTSGSVTIDGINPYTLKDKGRAEFRRRKVGYIFQFFNLLPELTVYENICMPLYLDKRQPDHLFLNQVIEKLGLEKLLERYPGELSGGEQQRVAVARALSCKPKIILADEPTGNLDKKTGDELMDLLLFSCRLFKQTILLVTHDLEIARRADRMITLEDGRVISDLYCSPYGG